MKAKHPRCPHCGQRIKPLPTEAQRERARQIAAAHYAKKRARKLANGNQ